MPIDVFVAYVDTYIGRQLLQQFNHHPGRFTLHGCTWSPEAATALNEEVAEALRARREKEAAEYTFGPDVTNISSVSPLSTARDANSSASSESGTIAAAAATADGPLDATGTASAAPEAADGQYGVDTLPYDKEASAASQNRPASIVSTVKAGKTGAVAAAASAASSSVATFFSRRDVAAVREALANCDWIVVELRQSQEALDMLSCVQQGLFSRPKRFVLLSSFLTWSATPPLSLPGEEDDEEGGTGGFGADDDGEEDEEGEGGDDDVNAPYPPPPDPTSDNEGDGAGDDDDEYGGGGGAADDDADEEGGKELLTEEQYNRRVPHVKYYNWRDAEKAVAAAHRAKGLPLDTFVLFAGLPYGGGEELLEPFYRQAWTGGAAGEEGKKDGKNSTSSSRTSALPIFGDGSQRVPMMHVRDLATFTRKLLHRPNTQLPSRYIFATDGAQLTWRAVMEAVNKSFGGRCELMPVPANEFPLYKNVEQFTMDLQVERGTMAALLEEMRPDPEEGDGEGEELWVAEGGLRQHAERVALEFCQYRGVTPLRIVVQGPPLAGKRFAAAELSRLYRLPHFSIEDVADAYKADLEAKRDRLEQFRQQLLTDELERRRTIKHRRLLNALRSGRRPAAASGDDNDEDEEEEEGGGGSTSRDVGKGAAAAAAAGGAASEEADDPMEEPDAAAFELTTEEVQEAEELMAMRFENSARVARWRVEIGEMERVQLMRMRVVPPGGAEDGKGGTATGPMKKRMAAAAASAAAGGGAGKGKKLTKEQQRKKEEEELQLAKEAAKGAPFQDKALAIMLRWRLAQADCRTQGYILHGFPRTVAQARLAFGCDELPIPKTEEEALNPPPEPEGDRQPEEEDGGEEEGAVADPLAGLSSEACDERRLPNFVFVFEARENFLLDRFAAVADQREKDRLSNEDAASGAAAPVAAAPAAPAATGPVTTAAAASGGGASATVIADPAEEGGENSSGTGVSAAEAAAAKARADFLQRFNDHLAIFKDQFMEAAYSMLSYWECAVTEAGRVTPGGRRAAVHVLGVDETEPLVPPPPPTSAYAPVVPCEVAVAVSAVVGAPHNLGPSPVELHQEEVRKAKAAEERQAAERLRVQQARQRDVAAHERETQLREVVEEGLRSVKRADLAAMETRKEPLHAYLTQSVIPLVSKGLVEVAAVRPENPLEYLAEWLIRHNPDNDVFQDI